VAPYRGSRTDPAAPGSESRGIIRGMALSRGSIVRRSILLVAAALALAGGGVVGWHLLAPRATPAGQAPLTDLSREGLAAFRDAFNAAGDEVRLVALLSPT